MKNSTATRPAKQQPKVRDFNAATSKVPAAQKERIKKQKTAGIPGNNARF